MPEVAQLSLDSAGTLTW